MHLKSHYGTNKDKCFYKHSIDVTFYILIQFFYGKKKNQRGRSFARVTDRFLSCHAVKLCFHLGSHRFKTNLIALTEMEKGENDPNSTAYDCAQGRN